MIIILLLIRTTLVLRAILILIDSACPLVVSDLGEDCLLLADRVQILRHLALRVVFLVNAFKYEVLLCAGVGW